MSFRVAPLEDMTAGKKSRDKLAWTDDLVSAFCAAQKTLSTTKSIASPQPDDQLWIVNDGAVRQPGIASTLYVMRQGEPVPAGFFSAKLNPNQKDWLPCEIEALAISASINHFAPYIIQSSLHVCILTDSKPCVQAYEKLCHGSFSASLRISTFLSIVSRYQASIHCIRGIHNALSDFGSRHPIKCHDERCQICSFLSDSELCVIRDISISDII